jgi:prolipoprotein diacylglyceryltransferase/protein-S-isoprenylcysteine O-methyltransferase Ste14
MRKLAYGVLFAVVVPLLLAWWARALDRVVQLPAFRFPAIGIALAASGVAIILAGIWALRRYGNGWPMSPFPPERRVSRGVYALMDHPLYTGFTIAIGGASLIAGSAAGLWIVTPAVALACAAFVIGYERDATERRFGAGRRAFFHVPNGTTLADRLSVLILVLLPWLVLYEAVEALGVPARTLTSVLPWDARVPLVPAFESIYFLTYPFVIGASFTKGNLREFAISGWIATAAIIFFYLIVPITAPARPIPPTDALSRLLAWERTFDSPMTAFPAFHVVWACLAARCYARRWAWTFASLIAVACVFTGMHTVADVVAGFAAYAIVVRAPRAWRLLQRWSEAVAASWRDWRLGPVRIINHGVYAGAGALVGVLIVEILTGARVASFMIAVVIILGAGLWAQLVEGSSGLLRPFGYFGGLLGGIGAAATFGIVRGDPWLFLAALSVAAPFIQLLGRIRCLVQGCCHGRETDASIGIRYHDEHSRVVRAGLGGVPVHATQLYSILAALVVGAIEIRLWTLHAPLAFITGVYLVLAGLTRFVEEHFRGEPQTRVVWGMRLYQWLALATSFAGAVIMACASGAAPSIAAPPVGFVVVAGMAGFVASLAYGVDLPASNRRFSRLA